MFRTLRLNLATLVADFKQSGKVFHNLTVDGEKKTIIICNSDSNWYVIQVIIALKIIIETGRIDQPYHTNTRVVRKLLTLTVYDKRNQTIYVHLLFIANNFKSSFTCALSWFTFW